MILNFFVAVIRVLESNPQLELKQATFAGAETILSTIEVGGYGGSLFWAWIIELAVIGFVVFKSSTRKKYVRPAWILPAKQSTRFYLECTETRLFLP